MQIAPTITFRGITHSDTLEADIGSHIAKLERYYSSIIGCRVLVEFEQHRHESGNRIHVRIDLTVPGEEIVVTQDTSRHAARQHAGVEKVTKGMELDPERTHAVVAIRSAFEAARRRLQDFARRQRGAVKTVNGSHRGRVSQLFPIGEYGYIQADDGHEVYFQRSSVLGDAFRRLSTGSRVSFAEEPGDNGPQASTVRLLHPRRARARAAATPR
jgi:cold shock CspA family protein/ribosome-associated translation inhibitor RaiA